MITATRENFTFTSPFIKVPAINVIMEYRKHNFTINGVTSFRLRNFERGVSDLEAIQLLRSQGEVLLKNVANIHSKVYIFDSSAAVISSANLTPGGLEGNIELGILVRDSILIKELRDNIEKLLFNTERSFDITDEIILESQNILRTIPQVPQKVERELEGIEQNLFRVEDSSEDKIFQSGASTILNGLSGWKKDVFQCLLNIDKNVFNLHKVYQFEGKLSRLHPDNLHIRDKIRQQLQILRDMGLLEFLGGGVYRKLWR